MISPQPRLEQPDDRLLEWWELIGVGEEHWCEGCRQDHTDWALVQTDEVYEQVTIRCERCGQLQRINPAEEHADRAYHSHIMREPSVKAKSFVEALAERIGL